jgi:phosphoribosyl 1,2-cyclic phosphate phosphodiesterase
VVDGPVQAGGLLLSPLPVKHGDLDILGWYIEEPAAGMPDGPKEGGLLYLTDTSAIPPSTLALIKRPHTVIIGGLRVRPHATHFTFEEALSTALGLGGRRVFLTHICHEHDHREIEGICEKFKNKRNIEEIEMSPAWDGLTLSW